MEYNCAVEKSDIKKIEFLNTLTNYSTFNDDLRKKLKNVNSDHSIKRWQCLSEVRKNELDLIDEYCLKRDYERVEGTPYFKDKTGWYDVEDTTEENIINRYFDEEIDWIFEDEGYELEDCDCLIEQAMKVCQWGHANAIREIRKEFELKKAAGTGE